MTSEHDGKKESPAGTPHPEKGFDHVVQSRGSLSSQGAVEGPLGAASSQRLGLLSCISSRQSECICVCYHHLPGERSAHASEQASVSWNVPVQVVGAVGLAPVRLLQPCGTTARLSWQSAEGEACTQCLDAAKSGGQRPFRLSHQALQICTNHAEVHHGCVRCGLVLRIVNAIAWRDFHDPLPPQKNCRNRGPGVWPVVCCCVCFICCFSSLYPTCSLPSSPPSFLIFPLNPLNSLFGSLLRFLLSVASFNFQFLIFALASLTFSPTPQLRQ